MELDVSPAARTRIGAPPMRQPMGQSQGHDALQRAQEILSVDGGQFDHSGKIGAAPVSIGIGKRDANVSR